MRGFFFRTLVAAGRSTPTLALKWHRSTWTPKSRSPNGWKLHRVFGVVLRLASSSVWYSPSSIGHRHKLLPYCSLRSALFFAVRCPSGMATSFGTRLVSFW